MATRVTLECTATGWTWRVFEGPKGDVEIAKWEWVRIAGGAQGVEPGGLVNLLEGDEELADAIESDDPLLICCYLSVMERDALRASTERMEG